MWYHQATGVRNTSSVASRPALLPPGCEAASSVPNEKVSCARWSYSYDLHMHPKFSQFDRGLGWV